jgi:photosystem II stability/assembly factor-like uncharacterized protein
MKKRFLIAGLILINLFMITGYSHSAFAAQLALETSTRWPTLTPRPTDTRWPSKTPSPTKTPRPTDTRWPSATPKGATASRTATSAIVIPSFQQIFMIDANNGWALADQGIVRTSDGGSTWRDASPAGAIGFSVGSSAMFLDQSTGWVLIAGSIHRTTNGGASWISSPAPFVNGSIFFADVNNGFALEHLSGGMGKESIAFYQTTDGGVSWSRNFTNEPGLPDARTDIPLSGHKTGMVFLDGSRGWISGDSFREGTFYLYKTTDGGRTWSQQSATLPPDFATSTIIVRAPKFFDANNGILPISLLDSGGNALYLLQTHDAGETWTIANNSATDGYSMRTDCPTMSDCFSWTNTHFIVTHDAGLTWNIVNPDIPFGGDFAVMDFVSSTTGWVLTRGAMGSTALYKTTNGGSIWNPKPGPTPTFTKTLTPSRTPTITKSPTITRTPSKTKSPTATKWPTRTPTPSQTRWPTITRTASRTPPPTPYLGPFGVVMVNQNDRLNIRSGAGVTYPVIATFTHDQHDITRTGLTSTVDGNVWYQVYRPDGGIGWSHSFYLSEYKAPEFFAADSRVNAKIDQLKEALKNSDGAKFSALVSPRHGVDVVLHHYSGKLKNYSSATAKNAFTSTESINWGAGARGQDDIGTFAAMIQPKMIEVFNANYELHANDPIGADMYMNPWLPAYVNFNFYSVWKPGTVGVDLDWREWLIGWEYVNGEPYLVAMIHFVWEP